MPNQIFCYRKDGTLQRISLNDVLFLETADNYVKFVAADKIYTVRTSLEAALNQLPKDQFIQIHRSFAIATDQIDVIGRDFVSFASFPDKALPVSKTYYASLLERVRVIEAPAGDAND